MRTSAQASAGSQQLYARVQHKGSCIPTGLIGEYFFRASSELVELG